MASERKTLIDPLSLPKFEFHAPDAEKDVPINAISFFDGGEQLRHHSISEFVLYQCG